MERFRTRLSRVLDDLNPLLSEVAAPIGSDPTDPDITDTRVYDRGDDPVAVPGDLVLGVNITGSADIADLLCRLGQAGAPALVVREPVTVDGPVRAVVDRTGVRLIGLAPGAQWVPVITLVRTLLGDDVGEEPAGDLFTLARSIGTLLDAQVTIADRNWRVVAYSARREDTDGGMGDILGRVPTERRLRAMEERGVVRHLATSRRPLFVDDADDGGAHVVVAVRSGEEVLGSVWAAARERLSAQREAALVESAKVVALYLLRMRAAAITGRDVRAGLLTAVLENRPGAADAADRLGFGDVPVCVLAASARGGAEPGGDGARVRLAEALTTRFAAVQPRSAVALVDGVSYVVVPVPDGDDEAVVAAARAFTDRYGDVVVGVGAVAESVRDLGRSRSEADRALRVLRTGPDGPAVARLSEVYSRALLLRLADAMAQDGEPVRGPLAALMEYDARHQTGFVDTVLAWLDTFGNVNEAAALVHVHPNTFRYRMRRLVEISGLNLDDPDERLGLLLQVRLGRANPGGA